MRFCIRYTCCSNLRQGNLRQLSLSGSGSVCRFILGAFVSGILLVPLSSRSLCLRQHIHRLSRWPWLLRQSSSQAACGLDTCSSSRSPVRACLRVIPFRRSVFHCCRSVLSTRWDIGVNKGGKRAAFPFASKWNWIASHRYLLVKSLSLFDLVSFMMAHNAHSIYSSC